MPTSTGASASSGLHRTRGGIDRASKNPYPLLHRRIPSGMGVYASDGSTTSQRSRYPCGLASMLNTTTAVQEVYSGAPGGGIEQRRCAPWWTGMRSHPIGPGTGYAMCECESNGSVISHYIRAEIEDVDVVGPGSTPGRLESTRVGVRRF